MEVKKGIYKHFKGNYYEVLCVAKNSETLEDMVVYKALYGDFGIWVRPLAMWNEKVTIENVTYPRFLFISDK